MSKLKENFFVSAKLVVQQDVIPSIPCKIYLPEKTGGKPWVEFKPKKEEFDRIARSHEGSLEAEVIGFDKIKDVSIESPTVYFRDMKTTYWGPDFYESVICGDPQNMKVVRHLRETEKSQKCSIIFWISPNKMLSPVMTEIEYHTGKIDVNRILQMEFMLSNGHKLMFDKHYKSKNIDKDESTHWSYLVAEIDFDSKICFEMTDKNKLLLEIDDFLLIASLGATTRTACLGWESFDLESITTFYRGYYSFPEGKSEPCFDQGLVSKSDFKDFIEACYPTFSSFKGQDELRTAIWAVVPGRSKVLEESFLSVFKGLEGLILNFRKEKQLEFVLSNPEEWKSTKEQIKKCIKDSRNPKLSSIQRSNFYKKLNELNRISLRVVFDQFCSEYNIDLSDLWPVFGDKHQAGLSDIRNHIIHGEKLSEDLHDALWVAEENLRFALERVILCILGWPVARSEVSTNILSTHSTAMKMLPEELPRISGKILS